MSNKIERATASPVNSSSPFEASISCTLALARCPQYIPQRPRRYSLAQAIFGSSFATTIRHTCQSFKNQRIRTGIASCRNPKNYWPVYEVLLSRSHGHALNNNGKRAAVTSEPELISENIHHKAVEDDGFGQELYISIRNNHFMRNFLCPVSTIHTSREAALVATRHTRLHRIDEDCSKLFSPDSTSITIWSLMHFII